MQDVTCQVVRLDSLSMCDEADRIASPNSCFSPFDTGGVDCERGPLASDILVIAPESPSLPFSVRPALVAEPGPAVAPDDVPPANALVVEGGTVPAVEEELVPEPRSPRKAMEAAGISASVAILRGGSCYPSACLEDSDGSVAVRESLPDAGFGLGAERELELAEASAAAVGVEVARVEATALDAMGAGDLTAMRQQLGLLLAGADILRRKVADREASAGQSPANTGEQSTRQGEHSWVVEIDRRVWPRIGIDVDECHDGTLAVKSVSNVDAIGAWNEANPGLEVRRGDLICAVDGQAHSLIQACKADHLLKLTIVRGRLITEATPQP